MFEQTLHVTLVEGAQGVQMSAVKKRTLQRVASGHTAVIQHAQLHL